MTVRISIADRVGDFAENKDAARQIRLEELQPQLSSGKTVELDFEGVSIATQSFVHALLSQLIRNDPDVLDLIRFSNCNANLQSLIGIVVEYSQETM